MSTLKPKAAPLRALKADTTSQPAQAKALANQISAKALVALLCECF
jgi:hypothetical protein